MAHLTHARNSSIGAPLINIGADLIATLSNPKGCLMHRVNCKLAKRDPATRIYAMLVTGKQTFPSDPAGFAAVTEQS
ncbi:unnamed protein product [Lasius platythorax]|uniref:Uncharacterized protein n=1 Tax=Lasius platythorax TaxID=488582 RepID=A0AAV2NK60_9HYME